MRKNSCNTATAESVRNDDWLVFCGSYTGCALGVLVTFLAFTFTYRQNAEQNGDVKEQDQNDISRQIIETQMRLQVLPFINARKSIQAKRENEDKQLLFNNNGIPILSINKSVAGDICFTNIGVAPANEVTISSVNIGYFSKFESKVLSIEIPSKPGHIELQINYKDQKSRTYRQLLRLQKVNRHSGYEELFVKEITPPELLADALRD